MKNLKLKNQWFHWHFFKGFDQEIWIIFFTEHRLVLNVGNYNLIRNLSHLMPYKEFISLLFAFIAFKAGVIFISSSWKNFSGVFLKTENLYKSKYGYHFNFKLLTKFPSEIARSRD